MKTERIDIDPTAAAALANICTVAAEVYAAHARKLRDAGFASLASQSERQARDAQRWVWALNATESGHVIVVADDEDDEGGDE